MFENFPYTDMHQLNLDWIIKIAKDFLDQYTHLQQLITDGEASLQNLTDEGVQTLVTKTDQLETLLNEWYDTHSADIADQLADALSDLNDWYTTHQNYLDETLISKIAAFNTAADTKAAQTIASIPDDYTTLSNKVELNRLIDFGLGQVNKIESVTGKYINYANGDPGSHAEFNYFIVPATAGDKFIYNSGRVQTSAGVIFYNDFIIDVAHYISGVVGTAAYQTVTAPANTKCAAFVYQPALIDESLVAFYIKGVEEDIFLSKYIDLGIGKIANKKIVTGKYIEGSTGYVGSHASFNYVMIPCKPGDKFIYNSGNKQTSAGMAFYTDFEFHASKYISGVLGNKTYQEVVAPANAKYAGFTYIPNDIDSEMVVFNNNSLFELDNKVLNGMKHYYASKTPFYQILKNIPQGTEIFFRTNKVGITGNETGLTLYGGVGTTNPTFTTLLPNCPVNTMYKVITDRDYDFLHIAIQPYNGSYSGEFEFEIQALEYETDVNVLYNEVYGTGKLTCGIFKKVVVCGDSYTTGFIQLPGETTKYNDNPNYSWVNYMAKMTGNEYIPCASSGASTLTWQTRENCLSKAVTVGHVQAYIIGLGLNDASNVTAVMVPLGSPSDIGTDNQTFYGGMSKVIRELNAISPNAKIFVNTMPKLEVNYNNYNNAIRYIVDQYKNTYPVYCIDLHAVRHLYTANKILAEDYSNGHYTPIGYEQLAEIYIRVWSDYINRHISEFQDVFKIPY